MDRRSFVFGTAAVAAAGPAFAQDADPSRTITMVNEEAIAAIGRVRK